MHATTLPIATRVIYAATQHLEQALAQHAALAKLIAGRLPDDSEDQLAAIRARITRAFASHDAAVRESSKGAA